MDEVVDVVFSGGLWVVEEVVSTESFRSSVVVEVFSGTVEEVVSTESFNRVVVDVFSVCVVDVEVSCAGSEVVVSCVLVDVDEVSDAPESSFVVDVTGSIVDEVVVWRVDVDGITGGVDVVSPADSCVVEVEVSSGAAVSRVDDVAASIVDEVVCAVEADVDVVSERVEVDDETGAAREVDEEDVDVWEVVVSFCWRDASSA